MRILHVSTRLILGGSQENTVLSCEEQARRGHDVHLAYGPIFGPEGSLLDRVRAFRVDGRAGITTHEVPHLVREISPVSDWRARRELLQLVERLGPDVVHTHSSKAGILGRLAAWRAVPRPGVVHTIHGPPWMPVEGSVLARARAWALNRAYVQAERRAARACHEIVGVADAMGRQFLARGIGRAGQYSTVRSGMEVGAFLEAAPGESRGEVRARLGISPTDWVVGTVARLAEHKGHDDLLEAIGAFVRSRRGVRLLWVGDGWWRERLLARARGLGIGVAELDRGAGSAGEAGLIVTGLVGPERIAGLVRAMDVLAHPSVREGLPRTVVQALLCGVCPVAYDVDGTGEVCVEGRTGRLVGAGDVEGLGWALAWCESHREEAAGLARRGREEVSRAYSVGAMVDGLEGVYVRAVGAARGVVE